MTLHELTATLGTLSPPRRNHYFYGKRMDVQHFSMEQDYGKLKQWLLNRLALGKGVLCGLDVVIKDDALCVMPGVAIDGFGREIIVPDRICIDPTKKPAHGCCDDHPVDDGHAAAAVDTNRRIVTLWVCYRECRTDLEPTLVADCEIRQRCAPGTTVESYCFKVTDGLPPAIGDPEWCDEIWKRPDAQGSTPQLDTHGHDAPETGSHVMHDAAETADADLHAIYRLRLCELLKDDCSVDGDPCVPIAVALVSDGRITKIDTCLFRPRVYSNALLLDLILCLAVKVDGCCRGHGTPVETLRVAKVEFLDINGNVMQQLDTRKPTRLPFAKRPDQIRVTFTQAVDPKTVTAGRLNDDPATFSFLVRGGKYPKPFVPGTIKVDSPTVVRFVVDPEFKQFVKGEYKVVLFGDVDPANHRSTIASPAASRLDGEPQASGAYPSGDGTQGGSFVFGFVVA